MTDGLNSGTLRHIVSGIIIILIAGWIGYISVKGITIDAMVAGINTRVSVLETVASTIKDDIVEIKGLMRDVRENQLRLERKEKRR